MPLSDVVLDDVSEAIAAIYGAGYDLTRTKVSSYMADDVLFCVLEDIGTVARQTEPVIADRVLDMADRVLDDRRAFQRDHQTDFCVAVERLVGRRVRTFLSANHVGHGVAAEVFFLEAEPIG